MVATDWTALGQTTVGAAAAISGGLIGSWMQSRAQERLERHRRRERFAEVLADVMWLLEFLDPESGRLTVMRPDTGEVRNITSERVAQIRQQLLVLIAGHPNAKVRGLARQLDKSLVQLDYDMGHTVSLVGTATRFEFVDDAKSKGYRSRDAVEHLLEQLLEAI